MKLFCANFWSSSFKAALLTVIAATAAAPTAPAHAGVNDPLQFLYIFPGARDTGSDVETGAATSIHCYNFSGATQKIQYVVSNNDGAIKANKTFDLETGRTATAATNLTVLFAEDLILETGTLSQGTVIVLTTSTAFVCTAQVVDASAFVPNGFKLHGLRVNPLPGTTE